MRKRHVICGAGLVALLNSQSFGLVSEIPSVFDNLVNAKTVACGNILGLEKVSYQINTSELKRRKQNEYQTRAWSFDRPQDWRDSINMYVKGRSILITVSDSAYKQSKYFIEIGPRDRTAKIYSDLDSHSFEKINQAVSDAKENISIVYQGLGCNLRI